MSLSTPGLNAEGIPSVRILGVPIARVTAREALDLIVDGGEAQEPTFVAYANAHALNVASQDRAFASVLCDGADFVLNDGIGVQLAARMRGSRFPENLNGSDFTPRLLERAAARGWKVYLLGAAEGVAERAGRLLTQTTPGLVIAGSHHGFFHDDDQAAELVRASGAEMLLVAMGNPRQELWLSENLARTGATVGVGVGAFLDFVAGEQRRAPTWMNKAGIEWVYRLLREPARMWRRYVLGNPLFLVRAWRARKSDARIEG